MENQLEQNICNYVNSHGRYISDTTIIMNAFWFNLASYVSIVRPKVDIDGNIVPVTFMGITIANSSAGKTHAEEKTYQFLRIDKKKWEDVQERSYIGHDVIEIDGKEIELKKYLPEFTISADGTKEGLYLRAKAHTMCLGGSVNITIGEMFDYMSDNLAIAKELADGKLLGKVIKGSVQRNISGIVSNLLLFGSINKMRRDKKIKDIFRNHLETGLYRRSFIYSLMPEPRIRHNLKREDYYDFQEYVTGNINSLIRENISDYNLILDISIEAQDRIDKIYEEMEEFESVNYDHPLFQGEIGSVKKIISLAGLYAIANGSTLIDDEAIEYAYNYHLRCRQTVNTIFNSDPQHKRFYEIIIKNPNITKSEIAEQDDFDMKTFNHDMLMLEELCYRKNMKLVRNGSKVEKYRIEELPTTDLSKMIIGIGAENRGAKTAFFTDMLLPFDRGDTSVLKLVTTKKTDCFTLCHFGGKKRSSKSAKPNINIIAFDIDGGMTIRYAKQLLNNFTYIIYTTKSHTQEFNRFRVLLPAKHTVEVTPEQYKEMVQNVADALEIPIYDVSTRNIDRLWYTNPKAKTIVEKGELIDILPFIPETELREYVQKQVGRLNTPSSDDDISKRIYGIKKYFLNITSEGNRNMNLFKIYAFVKDISDHNRAVQETAHFNSMLSDPVTESELRKITRNRQ